MLLAILCVTLAFSYHVSAGVFIKKDDAHVLLHRSRRANTGFLEEMKQGNLERECIEEICNYEEAREVFEDDAKTRAFWMDYKGRDPCLANPCLNNGTCIYMAKSYECVCPDGFEGKYCQEVFEDTLKCLYMNGGCQHFCNGTGVRRRCECTEGYALGDDGKECVAQVQYPCGSIPLLNKTTQMQVRVVAGNHCPKGHCPWQVLLEYKGRSLCGGVIVHPDWVITAAHCVDKRESTDLRVVAGEHDLQVEEGTEQRIPVAQVIAHEQYDAASGDSDIALLRLQEPVALSPHAVPVCLPRRDFSERELAAVRFSSVSGWGSLTEGGNAPPPGPPRPPSHVLRWLAVPRIPSAECALSSGVNLTRNMFCAGYLEGTQESCRGDDGSPMVTRFHDTAFLTGVVGWGRGCARPGYYGIYTKVDNFLDWLQDHMSAPPTVSVAAAGTQNHTVPHPEASTAPPADQKKKQL
ncbi:hypothetical protein MATL_G00177520 [Megalops atlanticus]|uniref:Coagulation factor VII n=1 Tax=Megalops atlanticus TaxID=7932 RepID=A0A9D3PQR5_MEGAT|nr:hypothetical protein MATL_G00177520 [Megalops atlanticus]